MQQVYSELQKHCDRCTRTCWSEETSSTHKLERLLSKMPRGTTTTIQGEELHPTLRSCNRALSLKVVAQPSLSNPALCRQDTTSPWSTDCEGNVHSLTLKLKKSNEIHFERNTRQRKKKKQFFSEKNKKEKLTKRKRGHPQMGHSKPLSTEAQTCNFHKKIIIFKSRTSRRFLSGFGVCSDD